MEVLIRFNYIGVYISEEFRLNNNVNNKKSLLLYFII